MQLGFHVNIDNCIGCRACEIACKQEYNLPKDVRRRRVILEEGVDSSNRPWKRSTSMACMHCESPGCKTACPVDRYWKDEDGQADVEALRAFFGITGAKTGLVLYRPTTAEDAAIGSDCIGCKQCMAGCPYGAPQWNAVTNMMDKCSACFHRQYPAAGSTLPAGRQKPACVVTCPSLALSFGDMATVDTWAQRAPGAPIQRTTSPPPGGKDISDPTVTNPSIRFTPVS